MLPDEFKRLIWQSSKGLLKVEFEYKNRKSRGKVICTRHGEFETSAASLLTGSLCKKCGKEKSANSRRLTTGEFVLKAKQKHGNAYDYAETEYVGQKEKVKILCRIHGAFLQGAGNHLTGRGCPKCRGEKLSIKTAMTRDEFIKRVVENHGEKYDISTVEFIHRSLPVYFTCKSHGKVKGVADNFVKKGCPECNKENRANKRRISNNEKTEAINLSTNSMFDILSYHKGNKTNYVIIKCKEHGEVKAKVKYMITTGTCPLCAKKSRKKKTTEEFIAHAREIHGERYDYGKANYIGANKKLIIVCKEHGEYEQTPNKHLAGRGCSICGYRLRGDKLKSNTDEFIKKAKEKHNEYNFSDVDYCNSYTKITVSCSKHGNFTTTPNKLLNGCGCPRCANVGPSKGQIEMFEFINSVVPAELEVKFKTTTARHDILIPSMNLAVEYHGLIWHSSKFQKDTRSDFKKHKLAAGEGVRTIHIYEDEWAFKRPVVERLLLSAFGKLDRIFARKTKLVTVDRNAARLFFETNHLQGAPKCSLFLGLEYDGNLVACMAFGIARSIRHNTDRRLWELYRYAATKTVVGGAGKLLKAFLELNLCDNLVSYSDERLFTGNMYQALGFTLEHTTPPDYCYTNGRAKDGRIHKSRFQRSHLAKKFDNFDESLSESENCKNNGFYQIFDCGKKRWMLTC